MHIIADRYHHKQHNIQVGTSVCIIYSETDEIVINRHTTLHVLFIDAKTKLLMPLFLLSVKITNKYEFVIIRILFISIHAIRRSAIIFFIIRIGSTVCHILKAYKVQISISIISKVLT